MHTIRVHIVDDVCSILCIHSIHSMVCVLRVHDIDSTLCISRIPCALCIQACANAPHKEMRWCALQRQRGAEILCGGGRKGYMQFQSVSRLYVVQKGAKAICIHGDLAGRWGRVCVGGWGSI